MQFDGNTLSIDGAATTFEDPIVEAIDMGERVLVRFDPVGAGRATYRPFRNLVAVDRTGMIAWRAELPSESGADAYYVIHEASENRIVAGSLSSYRVVLDPSSGAIVSREFHK